MSLFSKAISWAAGAADTYFGTGGTITKTVNTIGGFIGDVQTMAQATDLGDYVKNAYGKNQSTFKAPTYEQTTASRGVATSAGSYKSTKTDPLKGTGLNNADVQRAWAKATQNKPIQASLQVVSPVRSKGVTKSLQEAQIRK